MNPTHTTPLQSAASPSHKPHAVQADQREAQTVDTESRAPSQHAPDEHHDHEQHTQHHNHQHHNHPAMHPRPSAGKRLIGLLGGLLLFGCLLALGIMPRLKQEKKLAATAVAVQDAVTPVNVVEPHYASSTSELVLPGNVQAIEDTIINARTTGYLRRWYVDIGARVKAGQLLADIESPEVDQQLVQARAETSRSVAGGEQAQADIARLRANVAQAQADVVRMQSNLEAARADLAHANAKLQEAQSAVSEAQAKLMTAHKRLNGYKAELIRARTRYALAEKTWKRWQELAKGGAVSGQELDETEAAYETSQASVSGAQADVESAAADVDAAQAAVGSREGDVAAAQADVAAANEKVSAAAAAVRSGRANVTATQAAVTASQANARAANATVASSEANVNRYAALRGFEHVVAPFTGVITARNVDTGALINAGSANTSSDPTSTVPHSGLFGIARTDVVRIQVNVPQADATMVKPGQSARVLVQEFPGRVFMGRVYDTSGALDATNRTMLAEVRVPNPTNTLVPGTYAQVEFQTKQTRPLLRVPANTLIVDGAGTRVATMTKQNKIHFQTVQIGRDLGKEVEILQGLEMDTRLITNPTDDLQEGETVKAVAQ